MSTTACKVNIDAELYAAVKEKAKDEKTTVVAIVTEGFKAYLSGSRVEAGAPDATPPEDAILAMLDEQEAEAAGDLDLADQAMDPQRASRARRTVSTIKKLRAAYFAAKAA